MGNLFFKSVTIKNYKCFEEQDILFNVPNGQPGSGLNILIGENGNGKTTILEAINYLTQSSYAVEGKLKINDFNDFNNPIIIAAQTEEFKCKMPYIGNYFEATGLEFSVKPRERKSPGKLLSSPFQINTYLKNKHINYKNSKSQDSGRAVEPLNKIYGNDKIDGDEFNIFYFDRNRSRHLSSGTFRTTFDKICDDLNWKFLKGLNQDNYTKILENICGEYFSNVIEIAQKGVGKKLSEELSTFFENDAYKNLKIELLNLLHPFTNSFFALRDDKELGQIAVRDLGSGIEIILTLLLLRSISNDSKGTLIYLIDEPELHLHPKAQESLAALLLEESKDKQIIISTHSPYLFKRLLDKSGVITLSKDNQNKIVLNKEDGNPAKLLPWSPSWGEINFKAYDLPTVEFHNELYGYLQEKENKYRSEELDDFLVTKGIVKNKKWIKMQNGAVGATIDVTLQTYVRHSIHHPENNLNVLYSEKELKDSIMFMIKLL